jgi:predicted YcjX-like family ATPase
MGRVRGIPNSGRADPMKTKAEKTLERAIGKADAAKIDLEKARALHVERYESVDALHAFARARDRWQRAIRAVERARLAVEIIE